MKYYIGKTEALSYPLWNWGLDKTLIRQNIICKSFCLRGMMVQSVMRGAITSFQVRKASPTSSPAGCWSHRVSPRYPRCKRKSVPSQKVNREDYQNNCMCASNCLADLCLSKVLSTQDTENSKLKPLLLVSRNWEGSGKSLQRLTDYLSCQWLLSHLHWLTTVKPENQYHKSAWKHKSCLSSASEYVWRIYKKSWGVWACHQALSCHICNKENTSEKKSII